MPPTHQFEALACDSVGSALRTMRQRAGDAVSRRCRFSGCCDRRRRIETEELDISCEDGVVYLEGVLPSEAKHQILLEILYDVLDFNEVVDDISIDRQLWERIERRPDEKSGEDRADELDGDEEEVEIDVQTSLETGEPMTPPDEFIPEKPE